MFGITQVPGVLHEAPRSTAQACDNDKEVIITILRAIADIDKYCIILKFSLRAKNVDNVFFMNVRDDSMI